MGSAGRRAPTSSIHLAIASDALVSADAAVTAERLRCLRDARQAIDAEIRAEVRGMRADGQTWAVIGDALDVSRSAAQQRFGA
jgi:hypothetical protein